ncbi:hypothetical protein EUTSA_v10010516mg [Eutrema salsugineum]|uniref:S-acyltransferase n=1 Tax=Eutrema salsugineum TaxID=72664 RepID=V4LNM7_EUTSA|nr:hypothetical protein EUTSA_v10010516mg [Eutrema salsugineum]
MGVCCPFLRPWDRARDRFLINLPCLSDPVRRSSLLLKLALVALHLVFIGFLFVCDAEFIEKTKRDPWYMASYFLLFSATLVQYFVTSGSSPGYVIDAMRDVCETDALFRNVPTNSIQHASRQSGSVVVTVEGEPASGGRRTPTSWGKLVLDLYPPGTSLRNLTCGYCHVEQPPRAKHCHDCDRCVLQFDHHCVWLGTCVGQKNHCKFWWYICEETALCIWTLIMYIDYMSNVAKPWWKNAVITLLLVILVISLIFVLLLLIFHRWVFNIS